MKISDLEKYLKKVYEFVPYEDEILSKLTLIASV